MAGARVSEPEVPAIFVEPSRSWVLLKLSGLWARRELLYFLIWRDIKVHYKQTLLGRGLRHPPADADDGDLHRPLRPARVDDSLAGSLTMTTARCLPR
jgi:hypothetical protein